MIVTCGENVVDMIGKGGGAFRAVPGGSPLNISVALGRLGVPCGYAMPISSDALGSEMVAALEREGVKYLPPARPDRPTGLALVAVGEGGKPEYSFYREGAADIDVSPGELPELDGGVSHLHVGGSPSLGSERCGDVLVEWALAQGASRPMSLDPNVREVLVEDRGSFLGRCERLLERCAVCRLSDEDAEYMYGKLPADGVADRLLSSGVMLAVVTLGTDGALFATEGARVRVAAADAGKMSDSVAAGDCFMAALLTQLLERGLLEGDSLAGLSEEDMRDVGSFAAAGAAINCMRDGCDPPTRCEIDALLAGK